MGLFGSTPSGPRFGRLSQIERADQSATNRQGFDIIQEIQRMVQGNLQPGAFDVSGMPRGIPQDNALTQAANQNILGLVNGSSGLGSALQGGLIDSMTQSGAHLLDPTMFNNFFNQAIARPAQQDFDRALQQASGFVSSLGGERSGGFGSILGDLTDEFSQDLLGERARLQTNVATQAAGLEAQRLGRIPQLTQAALQPAGLASAFGEQQFAREGARQGEDLNRFLMSQPFSNPFVTQFLNIALGATNPGLILSGG